MDKYTKGILTSNCSWNNWIKCYDEWWWFHVLKQMRINSDWFKFVINELCGQKCVALIKY